MNVPAIALEWLNLLLRWAHVIAGIMWIGDSFLFMWMDKSLVAPSRARPGDVVGELWMVHSGGFYEVVKRRKLAPDEVPSPLHWFMWESYTTWLTGFALLAVVYFFGGGVFLVDRSVANLSLPAAIAISIALLVGAWLVYDALWSSPLGSRPVLGAWVSFALIVAACFGLTHLFSGRAAFVHLGAMMGTIMSANVWRRIIPAQSQMLAATRAGTTVDTSLGARAKQRSTHNHYMTLPVVITMLSNHFPSTYGSPCNGLVLVLLVVLAAAAKHVMSARPQQSPRGARRRRLAGGADRAHRAPSSSAPDAVRALAAEPDRVRGRARDPRAALRDLPRHAPVEPVVPAAAERHRPRGPAPHTAARAAHHGTRGDHEDDAARQPHRHDRGRACGAGGVDRSGREAGRRDALRIERPPGSVTADRAGAPRTGGRAGTRDRCAAIP